MRALQWLLARLFPPKCVLCQRVLASEETDLCGPCRRGLPTADRIDAPVRYTNGSTAALYYEGKVRESILRYKFSGKSGYSAAFGRILGTRILRDFSQGFDLVTFAPVSARRRRKRGYDQGELLARAVGRELGIPAERTLKKIRNNPAQSGIRDAARRRANVAGVYRLAGRDPRGLRILLVDDVLTTGATLSECARVLQTAGAASVTVGALACGRPKNKR